MKKATQAKQINVSISDDERKLITKILYIINKETQNDVVAIGVLERCKFFYATLNN